jgi:hypothetical protein
MIVERRIVSHFVGLAGGVTFAVIRLSDGTKWLLSAPDWKWRGLP